MKRIAIFGRPGSGKSVFAKLLGKQLSAPLYHLDCYYFNANWTKRDYPEFLRLQQGIVDQERWIVDGNDLKSLEMRFARADVAIYFNRSKYLCYWRICRRRFSSKDASDRPANCPEAIALILLSYMWKYERYITGPLLALKKKYPHVRCYEIRSNADLEELSKRVTDTDVFPQSRSSTSFRR
jgi:adenylate kinase family enzyme